MALMSDSWPAKVWTALPARISHSLAKASQAPETKVFWLVGLMLMLITSPRWSANSVTFDPVSTSHFIQVISPEEVKMLRSLMNRQQERYPECPDSSRATRVGPSRFEFRL